MNELYSVILEVRRLFQKLAAVADAAHRDLDVTASQRAVLETLADSPGQTVPGIARSKGVTRQHIQTLANQLLEAGLIEQAGNPAHKRSSILDLTPAGRDRFEEVKKREDRLLRAMAPRFHNHDLAAVAGCLREMTDYFETAAPDQHRNKPRLMRRK